MWRSSNFTLTSELSNMLKVMLCIETVTVKNHENLLKPMLIQAPNPKNISLFQSHKFPQEQQQIFSPKQLHRSNTNCTEEDFTSTTSALSTKRFKQ